MYNYYRTKTYILYIPLWNVASKIFRIPALFAAFKVCWTVRCLCILFMSSICSFYLLPTLHISSLVHNFYWLLRIHMYLNLCNIFSNKLVTEIIKRRLIWSSILKADKNVRSRMMKGVPFPSFHFSFNCTKSTWEWKWEVA